MRLLVWQWGRRGAGPRFGIELARGLSQVADTSCVLSLATGAEILRADDPPAVALPVRTYSGLPSFALRAALAPFSVGRLAARLRALQLDGALCAMPAPLDFLMRAALHRAGLPYLVVVHDADAHPGDGLPLQMTLQHRLVQGAAGLVALSDHIAVRLAEQGLLRDRPLLRASHPPFAFGPTPLPPRAHGGRLRVLLFGRLLPYKGLDLFADGLAVLGPRDDMEIRVVGHGPESPVLDQLRRHPGVTVENRWVPEAELGALLGWADVLVLSHREASQSGVAAAAIAARRWVVATRVGGLTEQLSGEPMAVLCDAVPAGIAAGLRRVLEDPPRADPHGPERTTWQEAAGKLAAELREVLLPRP